MNPVELLKERLSAIREQVAIYCLKADRPQSSVEILAATKTRSWEEVSPLAQLGIRHIGENRAQEMLGKYPEERGNFVYHFIGTLQRNKVKKIIGFSDWIQSIDSLELLQEVEKRAEAAGVVPNVLIEVNTSGDENKHGLVDENALWPLAEAAAQSSKVRLRGLMTLGPLALEESVSRKAFGRLRQLNEAMAGRFPHNQIDCLSMGMSRDYHWAILEGATMVRVGTSLFGSR